MEQEDYLETIYELLAKTKHVRISDVAEILHVSKPSVTQMIQKLHKDGYIIYKPYTPLDLTRKGKKIALQVASRHSALTEFFTLLGVPHHIQEKDIHGIEHCLSPVTLKRIKEVTQFLKTKKFKKI